MKVSKYAGIISIVLFVFLFSLTVNGASLENSLYKTNSPSVKAEFNIMNTTKDNKKLVYPGATGEFKFTVSNNSDKAKKCEIEIEDKNDYNIPLGIRVKRNDEYVIGNEKEWKNNASYNSGAYVFKNNNSDVYTIEWKWDYFISDEQDKKDTSLGYMAAKHVVPYIIKVNVYFEDDVSETDNPEINNSDSDNPDITIESPNTPVKTGDNRNILYISLAVLIAGAFTVILYTSERKRKD